jgi:hypothetical protein
MFNRAHRNALKAAKAMGKEDPEEFVKRSFGARHPFNRVFKTKPDEAEQARMFAAMPEKGVRDVRAGLASYERYMGMLGIGQKKSRRGNIVRGRKRPTTQGNVFKYIQ